MKHIITFIIFTGVLLFLLWRAFPEVEITQNDMGTIVQLLLVGSMLSGSVLLLFRQNLGKGFHYAVIWLTLGFACVVFYSGKNVILASLLPGHATQGETITIRAATDGHFHLVAEVNGKPIRFMIDTGASTLFIPLRTAQRLGVSLEDLAYTQSFQTANGQTYGAPTTLSTVQIGDHIFTNVPAYISQGQSLTPLMGIRFLDRAKSLEIRGDELIIHF